MSKITQEKLKNVSSGLRRKQQKESRMYMYFYLFILLGVLVDTDEDTKQLQGKKAAAANEIAELQHNGGNSGIKSLAENR